MTRKERSDGEACEVETEEELARVEWSWCWAGEVPASEARCSSASQTTEGRPGGEQCACTELAP